MKNKTLILLLSICLAISIIGNVYQGIYTRHKNRELSALASDISSLTENTISAKADLTVKEEEIYRLNKQITELEANLARYENQKEKYWTLSIADYKITLQDGALENTLDLIYHKDEIEKLLLTLQMGNDYNTPDEVSAEAFENCLGHKGFRLYRRRALGTLIHYYEVEYYAMEEELKLLAYRWGNKDEGFYEIDIDGDGINELICNVVWMADGGTDVLIYHFDGEKVMQAHGSSLLDQPVNNYGVGSIHTTYDPEQNKIHINYWQDALQDFSQKEYEIVLEKMEWWETFK